jgi:hypothetical protein
VLQVSLNKRNGTHHNVFGLLLFLKSSPQRFDSLGNPRQQQRSGGPPERPWHSQAAQTTGPLGPPAPRSAPDRPLPFVWASQTPSTLRVRPQILVLVEHQICWALLGLRLTAWSGPRFVAASVPSRSLCKPGLLRPPVGGITTIPSTNLETKGADCLCQALKVLRCLTARGQVFPSIRGVPPSLRSTGPCPTALQGAFEQEPIPESQTAELSFSSINSIPCSPS